MRSKLWLFLAVIGAAVAAAEPGLLFHTSFDSYVVDADFAKGNKKGAGLAEKDLQLRMFPGSSGKGNSLAISHTEKVYYKAAGNIDSRKGTVSLWIMPINWDFSGDEIYGFFNYSGNGVAIRLFKHSWGPYVIGQLQWRPAGSKKVYGLPDGALLVFTVFKNKIFRHR